MSEPRTKIVIASTIPLSIRAFYGEQLNFLHDNGFDITVITSPDTEFAAELPSHVTYLPVTMSRSITPLADLRALWTVWRHLGRIRPALIQYNTPKAALICSVAAWLRRVPTRLYLMWGLYYTGQSGLKRTLFKTVERIVCTASTRAAPDGRETAEFAVAEGLIPARKIGVVGAGSANGIDMDRFDPARFAAVRAALRAEWELTPEHLVVGTVARLNREKGIDELVESFVAAQAELPELRLLVVGPMEERADLRPETVAQITSHPGIVHVGFQRDIPRFMAMMDIFALPSWREGFGVVNLEAAAMGLPVISTDVMGPRESVVDGQTGVLVPVRDPLALGAAMLELARDPQRRETLGTAGRARVAAEFEQHHHWQAILSHRRALMDDSR